MRVVLSWSLILGCLFHWLLSPPFCAKASPIAKNTAATRLKQSSATRLMSCFHFCFCRAIVEWRCAGDGIGWLQSCNKLTQPCVNTISTAMRQCQMQNQRWKHSATFWATRSWVAQAWA
ncbi:hypothetical protein V8C40DRAFT_239292 [Trichoderma camerunense]